MSLPELPLSLTSARLAIGDQIASPQNTLLPNLEKSSGKTNDTFSKMLNQKSAELDKSLQKVSQPNEASNRLTSMVKSAAIHYAQIIDQLKESQKLSQLVNKWSQQISEMGAHIFAQGKADVLAAEKQSFLSKERKYQTETSKKFVKSIDELLTNIQHINWSTRSPEELEGIYNQINQLSEKQVELEAFLDNQKVNNYELTGQMLQLQISQLIKETQKMFFDTVQVSLSSDEDDNNDGSSSSSSNSDYALGALTGIQQQISQEQLSNVLGNMGSNFSNQTLTSGNASQLFDQIKAQELQQQYYGQQNNLNQDNTFNDPTAAARAAAEGATNLQKRFNSF